jgi:hypothetical protein
MELVAEVLLEAPENKTNDFKPIFNALQNAYYGIGMSSQCVASKLYPCGFTLL